VPRFQELSSHGGFVITGHVNVTGNASTEFFGNTRGDQTLRPAGHPRCREPVHSVGFRLEWLRGTAV